MALALGLWSTWRTPVERSDSRSAPKRLASGFHADWQRRRDDGSRVMQQRFLVLESARHLLRVRDNRHELDRR